jgi:hypothetical protein
VCKKEEGVSWFFVASKKNLILIERNLHPMKKATQITEQFQHFVRELKESFWGDVYGKTKGLWKKLLEEDSESQMARYLGLDPYERGGEDQSRKDSRGIVKLRRSAQTGWMKTNAPSYRGYRFPPDVISHAVWLHHRFCLSFRDVEDLLAERGITVSVAGCRPGW